jgi:hypothetical protein
MLARDRDEFILAIAADWKAGGGKIEHFGRHGEEGHSAFSKVLAELRQEIPECVRGENVRDRETGDVHQSATNLQRRARLVLRGMTGWRRARDDRGNVALTRIVWDETAKNRVTLKVVCPPNLTDPVSRRRYSVGGLKIGDKISVPANLNHERPRRLEPVDEFWRNRLRDGDVKAVGKLRPAVKKVS